VSGNRRIRRRRAMPLRNFRSDYVLLMTDISAANATQVRRVFFKWRRLWSLGTILLIILILILIGALPTWPYSAGWGYYPSSGLGVVVIILLIPRAAGKDIARGRYHCSRAISTPPDRRGLSRKTPCAISPLNFGPRHPAA